MSAPECDIKKKREIRRAKVAFLYYDAIKTLENTAFSRVFCYLARSERTSKKPFSSFRDIHTRMTVNQHCPEKINSTVNPHCSTCSAGWTPTRRANC